MRKFTFLAIALLAGIFTYAQEDVSLDQMLVNVNQSSVTSGIIYERVSPFANLYHYNSMFDTADVVYFEQAENELYEASNETKFISNDALRALYTPASQTSTIDIGILNSAYQFLNYNADNPSLGGLTLSNNLFYQISGKPPFNSSSVTMIAPLKDNVVGSSFTYNFKSSLWFNNGTKTIKNVTAILGDGISRNVIINGAIATSSVNVTYSASGYKYLKFTVTYSDNSTHVTYGKLYAKVSGAARLAGTTGSNGRYSSDFTLTAPATLGFKGYDETTATPATIQYRIFYANSQKKLLKPIIISDGFDPGDARKIQASDYVNYRPGIDTSIEDMMAYYDCNGTHQNLIDILNLRGYDVIIVNYITYNSITTGKQIDGGADFIERNAMGMVALIQSLNSTLVTNGSTQQLVIVGPSMGGQITRYALAYMEKQYAATGQAQWLHKTRLWISVDSPHLGANIPEGLQALVNLLKKSSPTAKDDYNNKLGSAAAKQQLINWHQEGSSYYSVNTADMNGRTTSQGWPAKSGSPFYQQYYENEFTNGLPNSKGYPMNCRKIALANGSVTGKTYGTNNQQTLNIRAFINECVIWCWDLHVASFETYTLPPYGSDQNVARFQKAFSGDRHTHAPNNDSRGNVDILPGGGYKGYQILDQSIMSQFTGFDATIGFSLGFDKKNVFAEERANAGYHCFIPTFSALGMKNPNQNWGQSLKRNLVCSNEIPFDSYFGHDDNTRHTSFDCESVNWLLKEVDGTPQAPWFPMSAADLSGPATLCLNNTATFSFASLCSLPSAVTWTYSSNLQKISSTSTSINVKAITQGTATITATFTNGEQVVKTFNSGAPTVAISSSIGGCYNGYQSWYLSANPSTNGSNWNWTVDFLGTNASIYIYNPSSSSTSVDVYGGGTVKLTYKDLCGVTETDGITVYSSCPHFRAYVISPNPAKNYINVSIDDKIVAKTNDKNLMYAIIIKDSYGRILKTTGYKAGVKSAQIILPHLVAGTYLVSIFDGKDWTNKQLIVQQ